MLTCSLWPRALYNFNAHQKCDHKYLLTLFATKITRACFCIYELHGIMS